MLEITALFDLRRGVSVHFRIPRFASGCFVRYKWENGEGRVDPLTPITRGRVDLRMVPLPL